MDEISFSIHLGYHEGIQMSEAPRPQGGASRKGNLIYIVPLDPAYKAGLAGHLPVNGPMKRGEGK